MQQILNKTEQSMTETVKHWQDHLKTIRTGRASATILDRVKVNYYGTMTPIAQTSQISTPEPQLLVVKPWDRSLLREIANAIVQADLKLNPSVDAEVIRINIPPLTQDIRKELVKTMHKDLETYKVRIRNARRDGIDTAKKNKEISEDLVRDFEKEVQTLTDKYIKQLDELSKTKEKDLMTL